MEKSSFGVRGGALAAGAVSCRTIARFKSKSRCGKWVKCITLFIMVYFNQKFQVGCHEPIWMGQNLNISSIKII